MRLPILIALSLILFVGCGSSDEPGSNIAEVEQTAVADTVTAWPAGDSAFVREPTDGSPTLQPDPGFQGAPLSGRPFALRTPAGWSVNPVAIPDVGGERIELRPQSSPEAAVIRITHVARPAAGGRIDIEREIAEMEAVIRLTSREYRLETVATAEAGATRGQERIYTLINDEGDFRHRVVYLAGPARSYAFSLLTHPETSERYDRIFDSMLVSFEER